VIDCAKCGAVVQPEAAGCPACGTDPGTEAAPIPSLAPAGSAALPADVRLLEPEPTGIGGWLVLPLIGLCVSPLLTLYSLWANVLPLIRPRAWTVLTTPGTSVYSWYWTPYLVVTAMSGLALVILMVVTLMYFLQHRRPVPVLMTVLLLWNLGQTVFELASQQYLSGHVPALAATGAGAGAWQGVFRAGLTAVVWIPYFWRSVRVRTTFVR
jgi:hypothetical protein